MLKVATINFPSISTAAQSEYNSVHRIFTNAFPWLFPGGHGDKSDGYNSEIKLEVWIKHLVYYFDGRFVRDKYSVFCFK